ncbi:AraC family transcriptional regulator [Rhodoferax sp.]|uniref:AraC family transcriptional regulator n=1 Tax=Rhodoferax sp. TaxID=50421 RepID=UPI00374DF7FB
MVSLRQRAREPELEHDFGRDPTLGYEPRETHSSLRYLEHGIPTPLVRWHQHEECELHLIVQTRGKLFVGDYIGHFEPGNLVLTGPRLPHNWISSDSPAEGVVLRDMVLQFSETPLRQAGSEVGELQGVLPLLERARHGIEFFDMSNLARDALERIKHSHGLARFGEFLMLLDKLAQCTDYRLLSTVQMQSFDDDASLAQISGIVSFLTEHSAEQFTMAEVSARVSMTESQFSRYFRRATGNTFTDFVNRLRINRACQLLMETDRYINNVCYDVGFNNVANFNRRFMQIKGMTPKDFRRQAEARFGGKNP